VKYVASLVSISPTEHNRQRLLVQSTVTNKHCYHDVASLDVIRWATLVETVGFNKPYQVGLDCAVFYVPANTHRIGYLGDGILSSPLGISIQTQWPI